MHRRGGRRRGRRAEHRTRQHRLRSRDGRVGIAHRGPRDHAALDHRVRPDTEERRLPQHQVGELADLDRTDLVVEAVRDRPGRWCTSPRSAGRARCRRRIVAGQRATAALHHVRGLPGAHARPRRCGPSPASRCRSSRWRRGRAAGPRRRWSTAGCGSPRTRDPPGRCGLRWWHTMSMSRCSSRVLTVCGRVGLVELGRTFACAATVMMSGAWPPPAPSV